MLLAAWKKALKKSEEPSPCSVLASDCPPEWQERSERSGARDPKTPLLVLDVTTQRVQENPLQSFLVPPALYRKSPKLDCE